MAYKPSNDAPLSKGGAWFIVGILIVGSILLGLWPALPAIGSFLLQNLLTVSLLLFAVSLGFAIWSMVAKDVEWYVVLGCMIAVNLTGVFAIAVVGR